MGESSMAFKHGTSNLVELYIFLSLDPLDCLTTHLKDSSMRLSKQDQLRLFENVSQKELHALLKSSPLSDVEREHMVHYHRLNCISHVSILNLMQLGHLPRHLAKLKPHHHLSCLLGKSRRRPWRSRAAPKHLRTYPPDPLGSSVSVDQLVISALIIKPQCTFKLTSTPILGAQLFANRSSITPFTYFHLLENFTLEETIKAKVGFERMASAHGVNIRHFHAENGHFAEDGFVKTCTACSQTTDFCGVNAQFQNGIVEGNIGHMQSSTRNVLINAIRNWPEMISLELWTLAILEAVQLAS